MPGPEKPKIEKQEKKPNQDLFDHLLLATRFEAILKQTKFYEFDFNSVVELIETYQMMMKEKNIPIEVKKLLKKRYNPHFKNIKPYAERMIRIIKNNWITSNMTLNDADKTMRRIWKISVMSPYVSEGFHKLCLRILNILDKWVRDKVNRNPKLAAQFIKTKTSKLSTPLSPKPYETSFEKYKSTLSLMEFLTGKKYKREGYKQIQYSFLPKNSKYKVFMEKHNIKVNFGNEIWTIKKTVIDSIRKGEAVDSLAIISNSNPKIFTVIPHHKLKQILRNGELGKLTQKAKDKYEKEQKQRKALEKYDLPKNKPISYLRFIPPKFDQVVSSITESSAILSAVLKQRYPKMKTQSPIYSNNLIKALEQNIARDYKAGIRVFNLEIYSHGTPNGLESYKGKPTAKDIAKIIKKFPDAQFKINTVACFGGGLRKGFQKEFQLDPKLKQRVDVFLQTKPQFINMAGTSISKWKNGEPLVSIYSTFYQLFFIKALQEGKTYGQAMIEADRASQRLIYLDPEALIGGEHYVRKSQKQKFRAKA